MKVMANMATIAHGLLGIGTSLLIVASIVFFLLPLIVLALGEKLLIARIMFRYELGDHAVRILFLGFIPLMIISYRDIVQVGSATMKDRILHPFYARLYNRPFGPFVVISKKVGWFNNVFISPADPEGFKKCLEQHIAQVWKENNSNEKYSEAPTIK